MESGRETYVSSSDTKTRSGNLQSFKITSFSEDPRELPVTNLSGSFSIYYLDEIISLGLKSVGLTVVVTVDTLSCRDLVSKYNYFNPSSFNKNKEKNRV